jgi:hypothetical protein
MASSAMEHNDGLGVDDDSGSSEWDRLEESQFQKLIADGTLTEVRCRSHHTPP